MAQDPNPKSWHTVVGTVDVIKQRELPNSDPAEEGNYSYQDQPWDRQPRSRPQWPTNSGDKG